RDLRDVRESAGPVLSALLVDDQLKGARDLFADRAGRQLHGGHHRDRLEAAERVAWAVAVDRADRSIVAGVHGLEHVERLGASNLTHDDPVGAHTKGVPDEVADRDLALALDVRWPRLQPNDVRLLK